ncbi:ABC transporter substrate-binding protein [Marinirhabdus gelatinilytica]|uniref:ABC-type Fe3+-hydroxamate transport system substrate-binding protein n=1 Tax=Marinirhabdus gelatinilytica TaxID=1703343 RepID=A0A370Q8N2_9FLAO|nr:helical backbone metal receptor [Marinirhabdus gelatinilytica]RDK84732.1 ABC-type Fe3+-hydroxamate transport system substrate-binding protein [Marinirhabdus gelatinilytica]
MHYKDQLHRELFVESPPKRIVSLVPSQTELLVDLGLASSIVGLTKFCVHPIGFKESKTIVGGTKQVHYDTIESLNPDIIICNKEENTKEMVLELEKIAPVWVSDVYTVEDNLQLIEMLGELFAVTKSAEQLSQKIEMACGEFKVFMEDKARKNVAYVIWKNPYMVAGQNTFIDSILQLHRFDNIFKNHDSRYPEVSEDELKNADAVFLSTEPFPFKEEDVLALKNALGVQVRLVDGEYFSWYGSRVLKAFPYFKTLHP